MPQAKTFHAKVLSEDKIMGAKFRRIAQWRWIYDNISPGLYPSQLISCINDYQPGGEGYVLFNEPLATAMSCKAFHTAWGISACQRLYIRFCIDSPRLRDTPLNAKLSIYHGISTPLTWLPTNITRYFRLFTLSSQSPVMYPIWTSLCFNQYDWDYTSKYMSCEDFLFTDDISPQSSIELGRWSIDFLFFACWYSFRPSWPPKCR